MRPEHLTHLGQRTRLVGRNGVTLPDETTGLATVSIDHRDDLRSGMFREELLSLG
jgi:hypothetical protein